MAMIQPGNIDLRSRPVVRNADGSISTVRTIGVNVNNEEVLLPTVGDDGSMLSEEQAIDAYIKTGKHLGKFKTPDEASTYAQQLHNGQQMLYAAPEDTGLTRLYRRGIRSAVERDLTNPRELVVDSFSTWSFITSGVKGATVGAPLETSGTVADILSGFGTAMAASGGSGGGMFALPSEAERKQEEEARKRLLVEGSQFDPAAGNVLRRKADEFAPQPETAHKADQIIYGLSKDVTKAVLDIATMGPAVGSVAFGIDTGNTATQRLIEQGVDPATAAKVGGVTGAIQGATVAIPGVGPTVAKTLGLAAATGPVSFMTQEALTREILKRADYGDLAAQHDPMDPLGLGLSIILPGIVGGVHIRGLQKRAKLEDVVKHIESGGRRFDEKGNLLTSPKGAQGEMQVMPDTATDPGFGVTPAKDASPEELARVGREYLAAMQKRYGETDKALAAYNAGPGAVDAAVKKHGDDWLQHMPEETRNYVAKANKLMGEVSATPEAVDAARVRLTDEALASNLPDSPTARAEILRAEDELGAGRVPEVQETFAVEVRELGEFDADLFAQLANNASGESAASQEAINRLSQERVAEQVRVKVGRDGAVMPLVTAEAVDARAQKGEVILQRGVGSDEWTVLDSGAGKAGNARAIEKARTWWTENRPESSGKDQETEVPKMAAPAQIEQATSTVVSAAARPVQGQRTPQVRAEAPARNDLPESVGLEPDKAPEQTSVQADESVDPAILKQVLEDQPDLKVKIGDETITAEEALLRAHEEYDFDLTEADLLKVAAECALMN